LQAAQETYNSHKESKGEKTFETLSIISGNFPQQAKRLSRVQVEKKLRKEVKENQDMIGRSIGLGAGSSYFAINGMPIDLTSQWGDPFQLLETVRGELDTMERLASIGVTGEKAQAVLKTPKPKGETDAVLSIPTENVLWLNNIETNDMYGSFPRNIQELLRPTFPGVLRRVRLNYLNMVMYIDQTKDIDSIVGLVDTIYENHLPVRMGVVLIGKGPKAVKSGAILSYFMSKKDKMKAWKKWLDVREEGFHHNALDKKDSKADWTAVTDSESAYSKSAVQSRKYFEAIGMSDTFHILVNGAEVQKLTFDDSGDTDFENTIYEFLLESVPDIQRAVYYGHFTQNMKIMEYLNARPNVVTRFNDDILKAEPAKLDLIQNTYDGAYYGSDDAAVTMWLVTDLGKIQGWELAKELVEFQLDSTQTRVAIIHCGDADQKINDAIQSKTKSISELFEILSGNEDLDKYPLATKSSICEKVKLESVVVNGLIYSNASKYSAADFSLLASISLQSGAATLQSVLESEDGDMIMKTASALSFLPEIRDRKTVQFAPKSEYSLLRFPPMDESAAVFEVIAIFDPASYDAQKMVPIISTLKQVLNMNLIIFLNCPESLSELPVKAFYRFVLSPEPTTEGKKLEALFDNLPQHSLLTAAVMPPESWLVEAIEAKHDLDNIKLAEQGNIRAVYSLKNLLLEGHCSEAQSGAPPRGMQIELSNGQISRDTIVMANLGYFQLKAAPGYWDLKLRSGPSADIYKIDSHSNTNGQSKDGQSVKITLGE